MGVKGERMYLNKRCIRTQKQNPASVHFIKNLYSPALLNSPNNREKDSNGLGQYKTGLRIISVQSQCQCLPLVCKLNTKKSAFPPKCNRKEKAVKAPYRQQIINRVTLRPAPQFFGTVRYRRAS